MDLQRRYRVADTVAVVVAVEVVVVVAVVVVEVAVEVVLVVVVVVCCGGYLGLFRRHHLQYSRAARGFRDRSPSPPHSPRIPL